MIAKVSRLTKSIVTYQPVMVISCFPYLPMNPGPGKLSVRNRNMTGYQFTAFVIAGELDLNRLAPQLGIIRKYRWEEPMLLHPVTFKPLGSDSSEEQQVYLYYFGGVVFLNCIDSVIRDFSRDMEKISDAFKGFPNVKYEEHYSLRVEEGGTQAITNNYAVMPRYDRAFIDIVAFVMVLDKPDITWENQEADRLYMIMANLFELNQRYQEIKHKSETLMDITGVFTSLSHARRASQLEWIIIALIFIEIVIYLF